MAGAGRARAREPRPSDRDFRPSGASNRMRCPWVNAVDTRAALWPARRMAELVLEARTELIDPALYSRAEAPMGAVRT